MGRRSYGQQCALARAGDVIGERWTLLLLRDLLIAPRRFKDLLEAEAGIGTNLLAARLKDLEAAGLVVHRDRLYALTARGCALEPAVLGLIRWGLRHGPEASARDRRRDDWDLLALKALFQPDRAGDLAVLVQFRAGAFEAWVRIAAGAMRIGLGAATDPDLVVDGTVADLFLGHGPAAARLASGDPQTLHRFMAAFALRA